ncbi:hypothetical protein SAMN05660649_03399 [Desulfotomaculum arcticum]|uniref:Uncharacterized protein n=1 Tax=Desulfotruncus arcticus DSM 17038 TaxID=1121424 RepID=A0A1I2WAT9_9FIRM|nr:hypothetical protein [Desulfotruncus arcticus]SFG98578.1 hypothetical protein SAMN05660649_03399 [Desulfotomaculum arcticum] [Desulfotruncus arcticus DSM 17038]
MLEFFTFTSLGTLTGAITATVLIVEFLKDFKLFALVTTRFLVLVVAEMVMFIACISSGNFAFKDLPINFLNGLIVASFAMASWQIVYIHLFGKIREDMNGRNINSRDKSPGSL